MHGLNPFVERPEELEARSWVALAVSATLHTFLMLWLVFRPVAGDVPAEKSTPAGEARQPIALPRPAKSKAKTERMTLVSADGKFKRYEVSLLW